MSPAGASRVETRLRPPGAIWREPPTPDAEAVSALVDELRLPRAVCALLAVRGVQRPDDAKAFLRPRLDALHDPAGLADGARAAERIARALSTGERILVHGDYDVDGICATALLTRWLRRLGGQVVPFVPHRLRDGYDFGDAGLERAREVGATLIVTADCGTVAHAAVERAAAAGVDVVVTDHHTTGESLPPAVAVVNPSRADCPYPDAGLCGAGVAYKLCELVGRAVGADTNELVGWLDLVALATVADLVPLTGENRTLVHYGLRRFAESAVVGIQALLTVAEVDPATVTAGQLGFRIAPRINAAGRIGETEDALRLLLTDDRDEADELARRLDGLNRERREEDERTLSAALEQLEGEYHPERDFGVVLAAEGWHPGVIGIVASRVVERIHRPVVLVALDGERGRGSARSIPGFHLYDAVAACAEHLGRFGGHRQAAGMDVHRDEVPAFRDAFNRAARERLTAELLRPVRRPDLRIDLATIDLQLVHWMGYLGPHGMGNPGPLLLSTGVEVVVAKVVGTNHLKVRLHQDGAFLDGIGFGLADAHDPATLRDGAYDVLYKLERNEWRGTVTPQARLVDLRPSSAGTMPSETVSGAR